MHQGFSAMASEAAPFLQKAWEHQGVKLSNFFGCQVSLSPLTISSLTPSALRLQFARRDDGFAASVAIGVGFTAGEALAIFNDTAHEDLAILIGALPVKSAEAQLKVFVEAGGLLLGSILGGLAEAVGAKWFPTAPIALGRRSDLPFHFARSQTASYPLLALDGTLTVPQRAISIRMLTLMIASGNPLLADLMGTPDA